MRKQATREPGISCTSPLTCILALAIWWAACWLATGAYFGHLTDSAWRNEVAQAEQLVATTTQGFERIIAMRTSIPRLLARDTDVLGMFAGNSINDSDHGKLNERFSRAAADLQLDSLALFDLQGNMLGAGSAPSETASPGITEIDREQLTRVMAGESGYRLIFNPQTGSACIAYFAPVIADTRVLGAIISHVSLNSFRDWLAPADGFLTNHNGVIVLASDISIIGRSAAHLIVPTRQQTSSLGGAGRLDVVPAGDARFPELQRMAGRQHPVIHRSHGINGDNAPVIHVMWPFPQRDELLTRRNLATLGTGLGGSALMLLAMTLVARRREQKNHLAEQIQREQALSNLANSSPDFVIRYDTEQRIRYLNNKLLKFMKFDSADQLIGRTPMEVWPDGRYATVQAAAAHAVESAEEVTLYLDEPTDDGSVRHHQIVMVPERDGTGQVIGSIAFGRDVADLKNAEVALRKLNAKLTATLETIPDLLFEVDQAGRYLDIHAPDPAMLAAPREELLGRTIAEMLPPEAANSAMQAITEADIRGKSYGHVIRLDLPGGTRWFEVSAAKKHAGQETAASFVVLSRDITERMTALEEARRLAQVRGEFLSHMSHELRTPLNSILGHVQLLESESGLNERHSSALNAIGDGGRKLLDMIDNILDLTRIEAGELELHMEDVPLARLASEITAIANTQARIKGVLLGCSTADDLPASVHTDRARLHQVLRELLANAVKFTERGNVELRVERRPGRLCFIVRDSGLGIAPEAVEQLFQPFESIGKVTNRPAGAGLGLALARRLALLLGGSLDLESTPGRGSTFRFELPLTQADDELMTQPALTTTAEAVPPPAQPTDTIPPPGELQRLHAITLLGNMRDVRLEAARLAAQTPAYRDFAAQIEVMAENFQSKALRTFIEQHLSANKEVDSK